MKFENVKVGDTVFVRRSVSYGFKRSKSFFVPVKVERVTKKQFVLTNGNRYQKENGRLIGYGYSYNDNNAYLEGEVFGWNNGKVKDETKEMDEFINKLSTINNFNRLLETVKIHPETKMHSEEVVSLLKDLSNISKKIN